MSRRHGRAGGIYVNCSREVDQVSCETRQGCRWKSPDTLHLDGQGTVSQMPIQRLGVHGEAVKGSPRRYPATPRVPRSAHISWSSVQSILYNCKASAGGTVAVIFREYSSHGFQQPQFPSRAVRVGQASCPAPTAQLSSDCGIQPQSFHDAHQGSEKEPGVLLRLSGNACRLHLQRWAVDHLLSRRAGCGCVYVYEDGRRRWITRHGQI